MRYVAFKPSRDFTTFEYDRFLDCATTYELEEDMIFSYTYVKCHNQKRKVISEHCEKDKKFTTFSGAKKRRVYICAS